MKLKFHTADGASASEKDFPIPELEGDKGVQALKQVVLAYMANKRRGTHSVKTRSTVHGTGKKPFRQKGTGIARQGTRVAPQHRHGSVAHGPQPRDYSQHINKKMRRLALKRALFDRAKDGEIEVIERWESNGKTKEFNGTLGRVAPEGKLLIVDDAWSDQTILAARNIARLDLREADGVNAHDLCHFDRIIFSEGAIGKLLGRLDGGSQS